MRAAVPLRSARGRGPAPDTVDRIVEATLTCLRRDGRELTSIAGVSRESGVSRQTIYKRFGDLESLVLHVVESVAVDIAQRVVSAPRPDATAPARLIDLIVATHRELRNDPVAMMSLDLSMDADYRDARSIGGPSLALAEGLVRAALPSVPTLSDDVVTLIAETTYRWILSLLTYTSANTATDDAVRDYLNRTLLPAFERLIEGG